MRLTPLRSLHVITSDVRRGAETHAVDLVHYLNKAEGHAARVVALTPSGTQNAHQVPTLGRRALGIRTLVRLRRLARDSDIVVAHGSACLPATALALLGTGVPFVYRSIGDPAYWQSKTLRRLRSGLALRQTRLVVALWGEARTNWVDLHGLPQDRVVVIPNAVSTFVTDVEAAAARKQLGVPPDAICVAFVGALSHEKNPLQAVRAAAHVPEPFLLIAGTGPLEETVLTEMRALGVAGRFLGQVDDVRLTLTAADVLVVTSRTEGQPAVIIEAGLLGTPTVALDVGGVRTLLSDAPSGQLVPASASAAELGAVVCLAATNRSNTELLRRWFEEFILDATGPAWIKLLESVGSRL